MKGIVRSVAIGAICCWAGIASAQSLIYAEAGPNRGARAKALQWFVDAASANSGGELKFDVQWGGALFKAKAALSGVSDGVADLGTIIAVYFPKEMAGYGVADLPLENADAWVGMRAVDELMRTNDKLKQNLAAKNLVYVGTFTTSAVHIGCKGKAIRTVDDIDGLKVRGVGAYGKTFESFGANLVSMSIYKAYQGLDTGLLDCSQGYSYATAALKQHEIITSYTLLNWGQVGALGVFMNKDAFERLKPEAQQAIMKAGSDMADHYGMLIEADNAAALEKIKAAGVEVIELPAGERAKLIERGGKFVDEWLAKADGEGLDGAALLAEFKGLLDKYAKERDEKGYPWARK